MKKKRKRIIKPWYKVICEWKVWQSSIDQARLLLLSKHKFADMERLVRSARRDGELLSTLFDELRDNWRDGISKQIRLNPRSSLFYDFYIAWIYNVLPDLIEAPDYLQDDTLQASPIWSESAFDKWQGKEVIVDTVSWVRGKISLDKVANRMSELEFPSKIKLKQQWQGGRPPKNYEKKLQAVVCALLSKEARFNEGKIGKLFGWKRRLFAGRRHYSCQNAMLRTQLGVKLLKYQK